MLPSKIVVLGSSSLAGVGDPENGGFMGLLKKWHEWNNFKNILYNLGISGDTTSGMSKRLTLEASLRKPGLIIIASGLNDTIRTGSRTTPNVTSLDQFDENIKSLISQAKAMCDVVFVSVFPIDDKKTAPLAYWEKDYFYLLNDAIEYTKHVKDICEAENIPYCDIFNSWLQQDYKKWLHEDGLHPNKEGHKVIYEELKSFLENIYKD